MKFKVVKLNNYFYIKLLNNIISHKTIAKELKITEQEYNNILLSCGANQKYYIFKTFELAQKAVEKLESILIMNLLN